ncbi:uncharacterized protein JCM6883_005146 [Sporobolomyces salmoneus]|uniref:uncharacterized protein n=1 Tax=Sporobolomyces salmoneus TaxID=183962 RepID=UPI0031801987
MGRTATIHFVSLRNCLVNLPLSITGPLSQRGVAPQSIAVQLTIPSRASRKGSETIVAGWTGLSSAIESVSSQFSSSRANGNGPLGGDRIEIDPQYAEMFGIGLQEGTQVTIELLRDLKVATSVNVTPLTADDWEILETNAEFVEMYLLNQVRAIKVGMTVACWINNSTVVKFLVDSTDPDLSNISNPLPLLLTSATELIVAPKSRHAPLPTSSTKSHDLSSTTTSTAPTHSHNGNPEWILLRRKLLRLLPLSHSPIPLFPSTTITAATTDEGLVEEDEMYLNRQTYRKLRDIFGKGQKMSLMVQPRPRNSSSSGGPSSSNTGGSAEEATQNAASGSSETGATKNTEEKQFVEVRIRESDRIGEGQVWIGESLREELGLMGNATTGGGGDGSFELLK